MPQIRPVSDLRNHFAEISRAVHEGQEPVILTKNGYGNMVVMSYEAYEQEKYDREIARKLKEAEVQAATTTKRFTHAEVMQNMRATIQEAMKTQNV
ncbi:MAG: type II toxin-antitoxin system Phd/YefM family antitoxin [Oscillospiraceae bacterium]|jgi:prevent-host-death family protein|nr:type II toxin-antitoxin system Phd/YefM family antitoxin [Oscillospiraceae bacterium]